MPLHASVCALCGLVFMTPKSEKELAFLRDLYIATDWGERFAELVDAHVDLPKKGRALYVSAGTGGHAMALRNRAEEKLELVCVDASEECLELARVARPGATVAYWLPTASSFGEFFSIYWEALLNSDLQDYDVDVEHMITDLPTVSAVERLG